MKKGLSPLSNEQDTNEKTASPTIGMLQESYTRSSFLFDTIVWVFTIAFDIFFREIKTRGSFNVPKTGPVILVCAPHSNQFVDPTIIMLQVKHQIGRRISWLVAGKSFRQKFIGFMSRATKAIPVERAQDLLKPATGTITIEDLENSPTVITGYGTKFTTECEVKGLVGLPQSAGSTQIQEIVSDTKLIIRKPFKSAKALELLSIKTKFKTAPKVDNGEVFQHVFTHLHDNGMVGIFPEGGSHDRTELLPLKAGVAIMALGASAADPDCEVKVIPCGLNYFHAHKFRSRAVIEFGTPLIVTAKDGLAYKENPREATSKLLDKVTLALKAVTVTTPDYDTLMIIQAARRLYTFQNRGKIPLPLVVDMNRRLTVGYEKYKDTPRIISLRKSVLDYNTKLYQLGLRDHQVEFAINNKLKCFLILLTRLIKVTALLILSLPGTILFSPVFIATKRISAKKAKAALSESMVKIKANDVVATWKILVALAFAPSLYIIYSFIGVAICSKYGFFPQTIKMVIFSVCYAWLVLTTYSAFRIGETGMDIFKSIKPLVLSLLSSPNDQLFKLKEIRRNLSIEVTELCNDLGPKVFPDFGRFHKEVNSSDFVDQLKKEQQISTNADGVLSDSESVKSATSKDSSNAVSRVTSAKSLSDIPIFSYYNPTLNSPSIDNLTSGDENSTGIEMPMSAIGMRIRNAMIQKDLENKFEDDIPLED